MDTTEKFAFGLLGIAAIIAIFAILSTFNVISFNSNTNIAANTNNAQNSMGQRLTRMSLTSFDAGLAKQFMDKNGDGKCDACGMPVEMCMDSGQIQCNMDPKSTIGILGSDHIHADFKVFINGNALDFANPDYYMKSSFIHVDDNQNKEGASGTLHMHATGVPLWIFFKSVGMDFSKDCLILSDGQKFCNNGKDTLKFYVNGKPNSELENYVYNDLDKILISYGSEPDLTQQLNSITDFAKNH